MVGPPWSCPCLAAWERTGCEEQQEKAEDNGAHDRSPGWLKPDSTLLAHEWSALDQWVGWSAGQGFAVDRAAWRRVCDLAAGSLPIPAGRARRAQCWCL